MEALRQLARFAPVEAQYRRWNLRSPAFVAEVFGPAAFLFDEAIVEQLPQTVWNLLGRETFQQ
ncbi:MAG: hypothetical protein HYU27_04895 [Acidobacteria bacterium]|nr:hypothetical protein [Acidobacteriota bacterium]